MSEIDRIYINDLEQNEVKNSYYPNKIYKNVTLIWAKTVYSISCLFSGCSGNIKIDFSNFDTSKVTNMEKIFDDCSSLKSLNLSHFDTSRVKNMKYMFNLC